MSKSIKEFIEDYVSKGFTIAQARNLTAQLIILSKIEKSKYVDSVLLKGGVVINYNFGIYTVGERHVKVFDKYFSEINTNLIKSIYYWMKLVQIIRNASF